MAALGSSGSKCWNTSFLTRRSATKPVPPMPIIRHAVPICGETELWEMMPPPSLSKSALYMATSFLMMNDSTF